MDVLVKPLRCCISTMSHLSVATKWRSVVRQLQSLMTHGMNKMQQDSAMSSINKQLDELSDIGADVTRLPKATRKEIIRDAKVRTAV